MPKIVISESRTEAKLRALTEYNGVLNYYIRAAEKAELGPWPIEQCESENARWFAELNHTFDALDAAKESILTAGVEWRDSWEQPRDCVPTSRIVESDDPELPGFARIVRDGVDSSWAAQAQRELRAEMSRTGHGGNGDAAEGVGKELSPTRHSPDFRSVHWYGTHYSFTPTQAACVKVLWEAWENGTPDVAGSTLLDMAGSARADRLDGKLKDLFKGHPAWMTIICDGETKGAYRLISQEN